MTKPNKPYDTTTCKYAHMHIYASMQVCMYASMQVCKYASVQVCKYASMQVFKYASMSVCQYTTSRQVCNFRQEYKKGVSE